jgi:hypothetical protein
MIMYKGIDALVSLFDVYVRSIQRQKLFRFSAAMCI